ncbi:MAG: endonuclease VII domain-containing protein [Mycobacteriaceae bacterium]
MSIIDATHLCPRCGETKSVSEYAGRKNGQGLPFRSSYCRACQAEYARGWRAKNGDKERARRRAKYAENAEWRAARKADTARRYAANPDIQRNAYLLAKYGITLDQYREMHAAQLGLCAICSEPCKSGRELAVDHDHATGKVRALLCIRCNNGLGNFRDDRGLMVAALRYLETHDESIEGESMPTYYVEDYDGERNDDAAEPLTLTPVAETKVVEAEAEKPAPKKTSRAKTKG